jgi:mycofactocin glycosyltransferase
MPRSVAMRDVTVAMPTADPDPRLLAASVGATVAQSLAHPLLIVDMSRGDAVRAVAARHGDAVRCVSFPESRGVSESRNRLIELADTRYVVMLDSDALPRPNWAQAMRQAFELAPDVGVVGARCVPIWEGRQPPLFGTAPAGDFLSLFDLGDAPLDVPRVMGTSYALDRERTGEAPFDLELGLRPGQRLGGEEVALCAMVRRQGWRVRYEPGAVVGHQLPRARARWIAMLRRVFLAGRESAMWNERLEPLPRSLTPADRLFLALIAPTYVAGRVSGRRSPRAACTP